jgi:methionine sulfoxide reductase heme-binding subunit
MPAWTFAKITDARRAFVFNRWRLIKPAVFLVCLAPMALLIAAIVNGQLSANPLEDIRDSTGIWTLRFLILTLSISPLRQISGWRTLMRLRRMIGLFAFYYGALHFVTYVWLDQFFAFGEMVADLTKRRFIMAGYLSFALLVPLALTSTKKWILRLGGKKWQMLHRLIYVSAAAGVVHYFWRVKLDVRQPMIYLVVLVCLLGFRVLQRFGPRRENQARPPVAPIA